MNTDTANPTSPTRHRPSFRATITALSTTALAAGGSFAAIGVATASPAAACDGGDRNPMVNTFRHEHHLQGSARVSNASGGRERWCDIRTFESGDSLWPSVCDYQGQVAVYNPDGSYANKINTSSFHSGCSVAGWFYHDSLDGYYAENKRFSTKWRSEATGGSWQGIGTLVD